jgi:hypothetical protein
MGFMKGPFHQDREISRYYQEDFLAALLATEQVKKRKQPTDHCERIELYQGMTLPAELRQFLTMRDTYEFVHPSLGEWRIFDQEFWLPDPSKGNLAEQLILVDQPDYLGTCLFEYFAWCVRIGSAGNGDAYFATFDKRQPDNTEIVFWDHEEQQMPFYIADSLSSLAYTNHLLALVHGDDEVATKGLKTKAKRIAGRTNLSWHYGDLEEVCEFEGEYQGNDVARYLYYRSMWIVRLLQNNGVCGMGDMEALFSMVDVPWSGLDEAIEKGNLGTSPPAALYWLWRCFFFGKAELLQTTVGHCQQGANPLVDDMATLVEEIQGGRKTLGSIEDMHALRDAFIALDLDPSPIASQ